MIRIGESEDFYGNTYRTMAESDYAKEYRAKHRKECGRSYEKKKAAQVPKERPGRDIASLVRIKNLAAAELLGGSDR